MSALVVQVCRADTSPMLQTVVGAAMQYWGNQGFTQINVQFASPGDDMAGVYLRSSPAGPPQELWKQLAEDYTAVLVMTHP